MVLKSFCKKHENLIGTCILLLVIIMFTAIRYDYYYDLNDDVLMKDILAGVYTGEPEGHNIQMLWLVSGFISLLYKAVRSLPWYGLFLCICHYGSLGLIVHRSLSFCNKLSAKVLLLFTEGVLIISLFLQHLVSAQYTITCTLLASAAAFLFFTTDSALPAKEFIRKNIGTILLVALAYLIRSEMLMLVTPLICVTGVIKWGSESKIFTKEHAIKYLSVIGGILAGIALGQVTHMIAYGSEEWSTFTEYFDNRTELYDFQKIPEYEAHRTFYESVGMLESEKELLDNYNFGLDEEIDEKLLGKIAEYAAANRKEEKPFMQSLKQSLGNYVRRTIYGASNNESDYPYNYIIIFSYLAVFITAMLIEGKKPMIRFFQIIWKLGFLGVVRTVLWVWLIMRERVPVRISHSMYAMELCILLAMLFVQCRELLGEKAEDERETVADKADEMLPAGGVTERRKRMLPLTVGALYAFFGVAFLSYAVMTTDTDVEQKAENNIPYDQLYGYLKREENKGNFYFIDVYSSVLYTEKMFVNVDNTFNNYDIMGGWACKSPLYRKKLAACDIQSMEEALILGENVYYVQENDADTRWLYQYYADHGRKITMERIAAPVEGFEIYQIRE